MLACKSLGGSAASDHLDLMRGGAAILVMLGHLRNLFLVSPAEVVSTAGVLVKFVYLISGFSHFAVMIFFALSGFLVGGSVIRGRMEGKWSWSAYFAMRLTRLWIVLIPALLLGAIWDHSGILASALREFMADRRAPTSASPQWRRGCRPASCWATRFFCKAS